MNRPEQRDPADPTTISALPQPASPSETHGPSQPTDDNTVPPADLPLAEPVEEQVTATYAPGDGPSFIGRYQIRELLGRGGMGAVYLAHDPELDRLVALKVPKLAGPDAAERFLREARAAAALNHPNLCPVFDVGRAGGVLYLAMAYVPGATLSQSLRETGPMPVSQAVTLAIGIARGMAEAHRHGIVHRDLKPGNVLLNENDEPVVTDFGLASRRGIRESNTDPLRTAAHDPQLTAAGAMMGTPAYMPPEQARGETESIGPRSDIYALGAILHELLTGKPPFQAKSIPALIRKIESEEPPAASDSRDDVPPKLAALILRALAKEPTERFRSMDEFADALAPFATARKPRRWRRLAVASALLAVLIAAAVVFYIQTDNGLVEVRLNDPNADVKVSVDGNEITVNDGGRVTKLRTGQHELVVKGADFETETKLFRIKRGDKTVVEIELKPKAKPTPPKKDSPNPDKGGLSETDRKKLVELLTQCRKLHGKGDYRELELVAEDALATDHESPLALAYRATCRFMRNDYAGAEDDARVALILNPETLQALIIRANLHSAAQRYAEAVADNTVVLRLNPNYAPAWLNRANAYLNLKEYRQAIADATRAIELGFVLANPLLTRAAAHGFLGDYDKALADYTAAAKLAPLDPRVFQHRAGIYLRLGDTGKANADWAAALNLDRTLKQDGPARFPDPPKPAERKKLTAAENAAFTQALRAADTALFSHRLRECETAVAEALRIDPTSAKARSRQAQLFSRLDRHQDAIESADAAIRLDPTDDWAYGTRGVSRIELGDAASGIADLTIAIRLNPKEHWSWYNRSVGYHYRGQHAQALADLNEALRLKPDFHQAIPNRGRAYFYTREFAKALADYEATANAQPTVAKWRMMCAVIRAHLGDDDGAKRDRELAIKIDPTLANAPDRDAPVPLRPVKRDPEIPPEKSAVVVPPKVDPNRQKLAELLARGRQFVGQGRYIELEAIVNEALTIDPESPGALALRATYRADRGLMAAARADVDAALKLNPELFQSLVTRAFLISEDGKFDDAIADLTVAIRLQPNHPIPWSNRALGYVLKGEYRQAIADATRAIQLGDPLQSSWMTRGAAHAYLGDHDKALSDLTKAIEITPTDARPYLQRSAVYAKMGNEEKAAADWESVRKLTKKDLKLSDRPVLPDPPKPPQRKKLTDEETKELERALTAFKRGWDTGNLEAARKGSDEAYKLDPTSADARAFRAILLEHLEQRREAITEATEAIRLDPNNVWAYWVRGRARGGLKDSAGAIADLTIALRLDPTHAFARAARASVYGHRGQHYQALADFTEALRLKPSFADTYEDRGDIYVLLGEYPKALADYEMLVKLQPAKAEWRRVCAALKAKLGDLGGANVDREAAIKLDPSLKDAPDITLPQPLPPIKLDPEADAANLTPNPNRAKLAQLLGQGQKLLDQGRWADVGPIADDALALDPESPGALALRATAKYAADDLDGARTDSEAALRLNPETFQALLVRMVADLDEERSDDCIFFATIAARIEPLHPAPFVNRAQAFLDKKEYRAAITDATRALELQFFQPVIPLMTRGWAYACLGEYKQALADFDTAVKVAPTNPAVFAQRSLIHARMGNTVKAGADRATALKLDKEFPIDAGPEFPDPPKVPPRKKLTDEDTAAFEKALRQGQLAWERSQDVDCEKALDEALRIDPTSAEGHTLRARLLGRQGRYTEGLKAANEAIRFDPTISWAYVARGVCRSRLKDRAGAVADYTIGIQLDPTNEWGWHNRGATYRLAGQIHQALADLNETLRLKPNFALAHAERGACYMFLGEYDKSLEDYLKMAAAQPSIPQWRRITAALRAKLGDHEGAKKDRDAVIAIDPKLKGAPDFELPLPLPPIKRDPEP